MRVVVCEPQCRGFEHALFNAALIRTVQLAFPGAELVGLGEREHLEWVRRYLADPRPDAALRFGSLPVPEPVLTAWGRFSWRALAREHAIYRELARVLARERADLVVLASITVAGPYLLCGFGLTDALARAVPEGVPLDSDLTSAAPPGAPVFGTCVTCHDPHGTGNPDQTGGSNHMVRYRYQSAGELCAICHI